MSEREERLSEFRLLLGVEAALVVIWGVTIGVDALNGIKFGRSESGVGYEAFARGVLGVATICLIPSAIGLLTASDAKPQPVQHTPQPKPRFKRKLGPPPAVKPKRPTTGPRVVYLPGRLSQIPGLFVADECICGALVNKARRLGMTVLTCQEAGLKSVEDIEYLKAAVGRRWVVVTHDEDFRTLHQRGVPHAGIIHAPNDKVWHQEILRLMLTLSEKVKV